MKIPYPEGLGTVSMSDRASVPSPSEIAEHRLPDSAAELIAEYERRVDHRPRYLWKWLYEVFSHHRLSSVLDERAQWVRETKLLLTLFYTLVDDLADYYEDRKTLTEVRKLSLRGTQIDPDRAGVDADYLAFTATVCETVDDRLRGAPRAEEFWATLEFDRHQVINATYHGALVNEMPELATETGTERYNEHNMALFSYADVDIFFSPAFDAEDLRPLRETIWCAQRLARISNWVATWEREVHESDPTSAVLVRALAEGVVDRAEITDPNVPDETLVERIRAAGIEREFRREWDRLYDSLTDREYDTESVDLSSYVRGMADVRDLYLESRGRI